MLRRLISVQIETSHVLSQCAEFGKNQVVIVLFLMKQ